MESMFVNAVDNLKATEWSQKEKIMYFGVITESIQSPSLRSNLNYFSFLSSAINILLLFCEDSDSTTRMSAEENLNKIIRFCECGLIDRVLIDLYHEIKKNGNEKSLRISLNIFSNYCYLIKQKKSKTYAQGFLPIIFAVSKRRETLVIETLCDFLKVFCKYLQISLNDTETIKLIEIFLIDTISDCTVKRRCSAQNVITLIENSYKVEMMAQSALTKSLDLLIRDQNIFTILGVLGFLRTLLPLLLKFESCDIPKIIEIYEICLEYLNDKNHSVINASLEVINVILVQKRSNLKDVFCNEKPEHKDLYFKRKSLKYLIFRNFLNDCQKASRKSSVEIVKNVPKITDQSFLKFNLENKKEELESHTDNEMFLTVSTPAKSIRNGEKSGAVSDLELESLKSMDFDSEIALSRNVNSNIKKKMVTMPLKSQKSTESIGSFINSIFNHSNAESVSKFFRSKSTESPLHTPKEPTKDEKTYGSKSFDDDNLSMISLNSHVSNVSASETLKNELSSKDSILKMFNDTLTIHKLCNDDMVDQYKSDNSILSIDREQSNDKHQVGEAVQRIFSIGSIYDQSIIFFTARLVCSKFLLTGSQHELIADTYIRVSIKNLSLNVLSNCVAICPKVLLLKLKKDVSLDDQLLEASLEISKYETSSDIFFDENLSKSSSVYNVIESDKKLSDKFISDVDTSNQASLPTTTDGLLDIKDDHFGENSRNYYLDIFTPLSKSDDEILLEKLSKFDVNKRFEETLKHKKELGKELNNIRWHCENFGGTKSKIELNGNKNKTTLPITALIEANINEQYIYDILLFYNHSDPILRGNVLIIIGNFVCEILEGTDLDYDQFLNIYGNGSDAIKFLKLEKLLYLIIEAFSDEIHTVVKQALNSFENMFALLLEKTNLFHNAISKKSINDSGLLNSNKKKFTLYEDLILNINLEYILDELSLIVENKYWLVQCKYTDVLSNLKYKLIKMVLGDDVGYMYECKFINHMFVLMEDNDFRVRNHTSKALCDYIKNVCYNQNTNSDEINDLVPSFIKKRIYSNMPAPLSNFDLNVINKYSNIKCVLARFLYKLSNNLLELGNKSQQYGVITTIKLLSVDYCAVNYVNIWNEFNILEVCTNFINQNIAMGLDLTCQNDLIIICTNLLAGKYTIVTVKQQQQTRENTTLLNLLENLLIHNLKILNIFHHLFTSKKPLTLSKGQKDSKEFKVFGNFGNDYFYLKLFNLLKSAYENYRISINKESGLKMMTLLKTTINSLCVILELRTIDNQPRITKLIEEILSYLISFLSFTPEECVICTRQLLKYLFGQNYFHRKEEIDYFLIAPYKNFENHEDFIEYFNRVRQLSNYKSTNIDFDLGSYIKYFEPMVIQSLKLFTKTNSVLQGIILEMLCQLLSFKVNYCLLDANNVFIEFVLKHLETIETGNVRQCNQSITSIIKFLFNLSKQEDKKIITIPKIINICDNLLANNNIENTSVLSLIELSYELFFVQKNKVNDCGGDILLQEVNTQKEVVFSMLTKFIYVTDIQEIICWILLAEKSNKLIDENELYINIMQNIKENKIVVCNESSYSRTNMLLRMINKNILLESNHFEEMLCIYFYLINVDINFVNKLSLITIIIERIFLCTEEVYLMNHLKLHQKKVLNTNDFGNFVSTINTLIKYSIKLLIKNDNKNSFLFIIIKHFLLVIQKLQNFATLKCFFTDFYNHCNNDEFIDMIFNLKLFNYNLSYLCIDFLITMNYSKEKLLMKNKEFKLINNEEYFTNKIYTLLLQKYPKTVDWKDNEINQLINVDFNLILYSKTNNYEVFCKIIQDDKFTVILLMEIEENIKQSQQTNLPLKKLLKIIKNVHFIYFKKLLDVILLFKDYNLVIDKILAKLCLNILEKLKTLSHAEIMSIISDLEYKEILKKIEKNDLSRSSPELYNVIKNYYSVIFNIHKYLNNININIDDIKMRSADEIWFIEQVQINTTINSQLINKQYIVQLLNEIKSESKLNKLMSAQTFDASLLSYCLDYSFDTMLNMFCIDCVQYSPHINYLKIPSLLKVALNVVLNRVEEYLTVCSPDNFTHNENNNILLINERSLIDLQSLISAVIALMINIKSLNGICLAHVEAKFLEKIIKDNLLKEKCQKIFLLFYQHIVNFIYYQFLTINQIRSINLVYLEIMLKFIDVMLKEIILWEKFNREENSELLHVTVTMLNAMIAIMLKGSSFLKKYKIPDFLERTSVKKRKIYSEIILIAKYCECTTLNEMSKYFSVKKLVRSISVSLLRTSNFYTFAITPYEMLINYNIEIKKETDQCIILSSIPIDHLNDFDMLEKFIKRVHLFGFSSRQYFEEFFMTLLVLINKESDINEIDIQEQYQIKNMCLYTITELLTFCKLYPEVGSPFNLYQHFPRCKALKTDTISIKKLHKIQLMIPKANIFYLPNFERNLNLLTDNIIGTSKFTINQFSLNYIWPLIEDGLSYIISKDIKMKNSRYFIEEIGIDIKSSIQLICDIFSQIIMDQYVLVLPHLVKICELCENRDQFKWMKEVMLALHGQVPMEDTISHQYIIYMLCKTNAILIPSLNDLINLCTIISKYLKSTHLFIRNATLSGLLCILESCVNQNTTIGGLSEELILVRNIIINYIVKYGIIDDSTVVYSDVHTKLVWTLNFYLIETTSKFCNDCNLLTNTIISANNILKRTTNLEQYLCILHGLERLVITGSTQKIYREKIEKLALDLVKLDNEEFCIPALKLLVSCMYIGSAEQLEKTEHSNGIVQDEPEVIVQSTEKIDVLFVRIKTASADAAIIFGETLCQIMRDLVPPNEILTKVIKELLTLSQPHCEVVAKIVFQVFRSAIDSSYLSLLQDWLILSLPNFLAFPLNKAIWSLIIIFVSSSINLNLIKLFHEIVSNYGKLDNRIIENFLYSSKDFYNHLTEEQKHRFIDVFIKCESDIYKIMLNCL